MSQQVEHQAPKPRRKCLDTQYIIAAVWGDALRGISIAELARRVNMKRWSVHAIMRGARGASLQTVYRLAPLLGMGPTEFIVRNQRAQEMYWKARGMRNRFEPLV
jgi:plasmid maintenance system antidote protein VapI